MKFISEADLVMLAVREPDNALVREIQLHRKLLREPMPGYTMNDPTLDPVLEYLNILNEDWEAMRVLES
jgi:hypothetical protein